MRSTKSFNVLTLLVIVKSRLMEAVSGTAENASRRLDTFPIIAGYEPFTLVTDHNALDLDQAFIEEKISTRDEDGFGAAIQMYQSGGHSKPFAELQLTNRLSVNLPAGSVVQGNTESGDLIKGKLRGDHSINDPMLTVLYEVFPDQENYVGCRVGALSGFGMATRDGCFATGGSVRVGGNEFTYTYDQRQDNKNGRTISVFSTDANTRMRRTIREAFYSVFQQYYNYYGQVDYGHEFIMAAGEGRATEFDSYRGNANFASPYDDIAFAREEGFIKGTVLLNIWMYVHRELEDAIDDCHRGDRDAHAWDEAVAFYTGSLEGTDGSGDGKLVHAFADKHCKFFRTCGENGDQDSGISKVNHEIFSLFDAGKPLLISGKCRETRKLKERIERLMIVPLVQGVLRVAHTRAEGDLSAKTEAEGAVISASLLPLIFNCNEQDAAALYNYMKLGWGSKENGVDFGRAKRLLEENYLCLKITCSEVGGLWDSTTSAYFDGATPCSDSAAGARKLSLGLGITFGLLAFFALCGSVLYGRRRRGKEAINHHDEESEEMMFVGQDESPAGGMTDIAIT